MADNKKLARHQVTDQVVQVILENYIRNRNYRGGNSESLLNESLNSDGQSVSSNQNCPIIEENRDNNVLPAKDWFFDAAQSAFQSMRNVASLRSNEEDFVKEIEFAFRKFLEFTNYIRLMRIKDETGTISGVVDQQQPSPSSSSTSSSQVKKVPHVGEELSFISFPLFVHIFIQLFECGYVVNARKFFVDHYQKFIKKSNHLQFLSSMQTTLNENAINHTLTQFKNFKCRILITEESFQLLTQFLSQEKHLSILQILNSCLDFRVMSQDEYVNQQDCINQIELPSTDTVPNTFDILSKDLTPTSSSLMKDLLDTIKEVQSLDLPDSSSLNSWHPPPETLICNYQIQSDQISSVRISNNLSKIVAGTEQSSIVMWDFDLADDLQYYSARVCKHWKRVPVRRVASNIDFKFLDYHYDIDADKDDQLEAESEQNSLSDQVQPIIFRGHSKTVYEMSFVDDTNLLLSASGDTTIRAWDTNSGSCLGVYQGHAHPIWTLDSNNSGCFLSGSRDGNAFMWDIERTVPLRMYCGHDMDINRIKFHPNCNYLATASADRTIILWDVNQVRQVRMFCGHNSPVNTILFSSCGKYLTSASEDGAVRLWDISQGRCVSELLEHRDNIRSIAFAGANDRLLASCGANQSNIQFWHNPLNFNQPPSQLLPNPTQQQSFKVSMNQGKEHLDLNLMHIQFIKDNLLLAISKPRK